MNLIALFALSTASRLEVAEYSNVYFKASLIAVTAHKKARSNAAPGYIFLNPDT